MTLEELATKTAALFSEALEKFHRESKERFGPDPVIGVWSAEQGEAVLELPKGAGHMLTSAQGKNILFQTLREFRAMVKPDMIAFATDAWKAHTTPAGVALGREEYDRLVGQHGVHWMFQRGYSTRNEVVSCVAQDKDNVLMYHRAYKHSGQHFTWLEPELDRLTQAQFSGRMKLF